MSLLSYAALLGAIGAAVLLDKWAFGEFGISQPIVSCPLIGLIFGDFSTGLFLGVALQLVWVEALPLGSGRPLDYQSAGVAGITSYCFARKTWLLTGTGSWPDLQNRVLFACMVLAALASMFGQFSDDRVKRFNGILYEAGMRARGRLGVSSAHLLGLMSSFVRGFVVVGLFVIAMWAIRPGLHRLPDFSRSELLVIPLSIGIAGLVKLFYRRERIPLFLAGAVVSGILWALWK